MVRILELDSCARLSGGINPLLRSVGNHVVGIGRVCRDHLPAIRGKMVKITIQVIASFRNMPFGTDGTDDETADAGENATFSRREWMKYGGTIAGAAALGVGASQTATAATTRHGISFQNEVNIVDDFGADPTGSEAIDGALDRAISDNTLIVFPEGTYTFSQRHIVNGLRVGFLGEGDVTVKAPSGYNNQFLISGTNDPAKEVLFENIDIDHSANNSVAGLRFNTRNGCHIQDVEFLGRGTHSNNEVVGAVTVSITNRDANGVIKNVVARKGSAWGHYNGGRGRIGIGVFWPHRGTVKVIDCVMEEFGNNGMYATRHNGNVQVEGGLYRNNNAANVRIHGEGSYCKGVTVEVDPAKYTGPDSQTGNAFSLRGIVFEQGHEKAWGWKAPGTYVEDCTVIIRENSSGVCPAIQSKYTGRTLEITNTKVVYDVNGQPAIRRDAAVNRYRAPSPDPRWLKMDNVSITGNAANSTAVKVKDGDGSVVQNCCINMSGSGEDGIIFGRSDNCTVRDTAISVSGRAVVQNNSSVATSNLSQDATCGDPTSGSSSDTSDSESDSSTDSSTDDSTTDGSTDDGSTTDSGLPNTVSIQGVTTDQVSYELTVGGALEKSTAMGASINDNDTVDGSTATGQVAGGVDSYAYEGEITAFSLDGDADVFVDGEQVDPASLGGTDSGTDDTTTDSGTDETTTDSGTDDSTSDTSDDTQTAEPTVLSVRGLTTAQATYRVRVSGDIQKSDALGASINDNDTVEGSTAEGQVAGGIDSYEFTGEVTGFELGGDGEAEVFIDGDKVDPSQFPAFEAAEPELPHIIVFDGTGENQRADYALEVSGDIAAAPELGELEDSDTVSGSRVEGSVSDDLDGFRFSGEVTDFSLAGAGSVRFEAIDG